MKIDVLHIVVNASHREAIRRELESLILPISLESMKAEDGEQFVLLIENKGVVLAIAEGLEICATALVRQCQVINANPIKPQLLYQQFPNGSFLTVRNKAKRKLL